MEFKFKDIHIGSLIEELMKERKVETSRACSFLDISESRLSEMFKQKSLDGEVLLRCSKLLEYDLFRVYSQHLLLYAPPASMNYKESSAKSSKIPQFRKNVYTMEIIEFIVQLISSKQKSVQEVITEYQIPRTTVYKWIKKHKK